MVNSCKLNFCHVLQVYLSILYLRVPESFRIVLRGQVVKPHNIADDLKYPEYILYKPQTAGCLEVILLFLKAFSPVMYSCQLCRKCQNACLQLC